MLRDLRDTEDQNVLLGIQKGITKGLLGSCMSTAIKPVKKLNDDQLKQNKKADADRKKTVDQEKFATEKATSEARLSLKRKLVHAKFFLHGSSVADGAREIELLRTDEEFQKIVTTFDFAEPVALVGSAVIKAILDDNNDQATAGFWIGKWFSEVMFLSS